MAERRQLGGRPHRTGNKSRALFGRELLRYFFRQLRGGDVDLGYAISQVKLAEDDAGSSEGVGLHHVATDGKECSVNVLDDVGPAKHQDFAAVLFAPIIIERRIADLDVGPHGAVVDYDAFLYGF